MAAPKGGEWPREAWSRSIWASTLPTGAKIVALAYAAAAHDRDRAFVTSDQLVQRTGLSRNTAIKHRKALADAGWLQEVEPARQNYAALYRLAVPSSATTAPLTDLSSATSDTSSAATDTRGATTAPTSTTPSTSSSTRTRETREDTMSDRAEPTDEALATFSQSHPGREHEALHYALTWYRNTKGEDCTHPAAYFGKWTTDALRQKFCLSTSSTRCAECNGEGWIYPDGPDSCQPCPGCKAHAA